MNDEHKSLPRPDPTTLTTDALLREIKNLKDLLQGEITNVEDQLTRRLEQIEHVRLEQKADAQREITAALSAAKEAVGKSEVGFTNQITALSSETKISLNAQAEKIAALEARINRTGGMSEQQISNGVRRDRKEGWVVPMIVAGVIALLSMGLALAALIGHH